MRRTRLVIADRHPIVLQGLTSIFAAHRDLEIIASCRDGASCVEAIRTFAPDVALLEDSLPDLTASEILAIANAENLSTRLVFFTASVEHDLAAAIAAGACSAISKYASPESLLQSLRSVMEGISLVPEPPPNLAPTGKEVNCANVEDVLAVLTDREREIMRLVSEGLSNKAVARRLNVSQGTIKVHLHHIYQKLEINNRTVLAALAISQRYGGFGTLPLAALTFAAMDDVQASSSREDAMLTYDGTAGETVLDDVSRTGFYGTLYLNSATGVHTYVPSNDPGNALAAPTTEICAITVSDGTLSGNQTYKVTIGVANAAPGTPSATGKLIDSDVYNTANTFTAVSSTRPSSGRYGTFMMTAAGVWSYTLDNANSAVQALDVGDTLTDTFTVTTAGGTKQAVTVTIGGGADAGPNNFDNLALGDRVIPDPPFIFATPRGDTFAGGDDEFQIVYAGDGEDAVNGTGRDDPLYTGSGSVNGNNGAATIIGGFGGDRLKGSNGDDTFVYLAVGGSSSTQFDTIADFKSGSDRINLAAFGALAFMALSPTAKTVPPHTIAWIYDSANNQTIVYVNQTDQTLDIGDSALLEIHLQGDAFVQESDFVHEPATATVAATGEAIDPALAATTAGDVLTTSGAEASGEATVSETARVTDSIWTTADESFSFHFARERVDLTGSARFASLGEAPEHATEDGEDGAATLASASSVELLRSYTTGPAEDHFTFDQGPIHASTVAMTTSDAAATLAGGAVDHGGFAVATATAASQHAEHGVASGSAANHGQPQRDLPAASEDALAAAEQHAEHVATPGSGADPGQSQRELRITSENGPAATEQHAAHDATPGSGANSGQSQRDLHTTSENGPAATEQHAAQDATPVSGADPGQSQRDLHTASAKGPAVAEQHAEPGTTPASGADPGQSQRDLHAASENDPPATEQQQAAHGATPVSGANPGQSQRDLHAASADASNNSHSESNPNAASKDQPAPADAGHAELAAAPALGDSFQFKSEMADSKHSDTVADVGNDPASAAHDRHIVQHDGLEAIQDTEPAGLSLPEQNAADHAKGAQHHVPHDLIV
ncbi:VCBS repeat-containing protein [Bradyrhizobium sp. AZCC 1610]|uniref:VCBS domain-containing protein n=1 Tax=Bradyrhizobium sp. AZCC 1610 TaxID=3117020 RepID=UPI002FF35C7D